MIVVDRVYKGLELPEQARAFARDTLTLGWEDRVRVHGRRLTDAGVEIGTALPRGTVLRAGDYLLVEDLRLVVAIVERPEAVFVIAPRGAQEWALFAYHIGHR